MLRYGSAAEQRPGTMADSWRQRVSGLVALPELIRQLGGDPAAVLKSVGLDTHALDSAAYSLPYVTMERLLREACVQTGCDHVGLLAGHAWRLNDLGLPGELVRHSATLGEALHTMVVHQHLNSDGALVFAREHGAVVDFGYAIYHPSVVDGAQILDGAMAVAVGLMRELCGPAWNPAQVFLPHAEPADVAPFRKVFRVRPQFNAEFAALRFPAALMDMPLQGAEPRRRRAAEKRAEAADDVSLLQRTYRAVRLLLLDNRHSGDDIAQMLSIHRRTLNRRLRAQGTTFQEVLDRVRFDAARQLLSGSELSLDDVAAALGYGAVSSFMRSFQRWAGTTPGQWRRNNLRPRAHAAGRRGRR